MRSVGDRVRKGLIVGKRAAANQTRGNDLEGPSLVMRERGIWHLELGVEEPVLDAVRTSCSSWCKTSPLSCVFSSEATRVPGTYGVDEARNQSKSPLVKGPVHSRQQERFFAGVLAPRDSWRKAGFVVLVCLSFRR